MQPRVFPGAVSLTRATLREDRKRPEPILRFRLARRKVSLPRKAFPLSILFFFYASFARFVNQRTLLLGRACTFVRGRLWRSVGRLPYNFGVASITFGSPF